MYAGRMAVVVRKCLKNRLFSYLATPTTLVAMVTKKMKYIDDFNFSLLMPSISGYPKNKINPFCYFLSQQLSFKNGQKVQFQASSNIHVAMETKLRHTTKQACVQLFRFVSMLRMLYKLISTHLFLLAILFHKLRHFSNFAIMLLRWLPWIPNIQNILTFFIL